MPTGMPCRKLRYGDGDDSSSNDDSSSWEYGSCASMPSLASNEACDARDDERDAKTAAASLIQRSAKRMHERQIARCQLRRLEIDEAFVTEQFGSREAMHQLLDDMRASSYVRLCVAELTERQDAAAILIQRSAMRMCQIARCQQRRRDLDEAFVNEQFGSRVAMHQLLDDMRARSYGRPRTAEATEYQAARATATAWGDMVRGDMVGVGRQFSSLCVSRSSSSASPASLLASDGIEAHEQYSLELTSSSESLSAS